MSGSRTMSGDRHERATRALSELAAHRSDHQRMGIQCQRSHHLAAVYETAEGLVYQSRTGPRSHGASDRIATGPRGSHSGEEFVDLLEVDDTVDDAVPAWCSCGPRTLSRRLIIAHLREGGPHAKGSTVTM